MRTYSQVNRFIEPGHHCSNYRQIINKTLPRLVFIDEKSTNTRLTKRTGWSPKGERYQTHAPFGKWHTQTFIAGLRCHGMVARRGSSMRQ